MKILVSSYTDERFLPVMRRVCDELGATVTDWFVAHPSRNPEITPARHLPGAVVHHPSVASRGLLPYPFDARRMPAVDRTLIERMLPYERTFMQMLEFYDPTGSEFSTLDRGEAYHSLLQFGLHILRERKPDLYLSCTIPHGTHAYILYALCRAHGIPTLNLMAFAVPGYCFLQPSLEEGDAAIVDRYRANLEAYRDAAPDLPPDVDAYYQRLRGDYSAGIPWYLRLRDHAAADRRGSWTDWLPNPFDRRNYARVLLREARRAAFFCARWLSAPAQTWRAWTADTMEDFFKRSGVRLRDARASKKEYQRVLAIGRKARRRLLKTYLALQEPGPEPGIPFIFVPLHYQPEASTSPLGGYFADHVAMVDLLSKCLPDGWRICVKENKSIFDPYLRGSFARDSDYYTRLAAIPGVTLVSMDLTPFELIDRAQAVATVTGTAGWEALARGKPAIAFGNAWYRPCHGAFDGSREENLRAAIAAVEEGFVVDQAKVRVFLKTLTEVGVRADRDEYTLTDLTPDQSEDALAAYFVRTMRKLVK